MKRVCFILFPIFLLLISGCSKDEGTTGPGLGGLGLGGGQTGGNVTFQISVMQDQQGIYFGFKPSTDMVLTTITLKYAAGNFQDVVQGDGTTVFTTAEGFHVGPYTGITSGQQWTFTIAGKTGSAQGNAFSVNSSYTVP